MVNPRCLGRLSLLAAGLGVGVAIAATPEVASADSSTDWLSSIDSLLSGGGLSGAPTDLNLAISIDGHSLVSVGSATANSGTGDIAIAYGANSTAFAGGGYGDYAMADGTNALAKAGDAATGATGSNFDSATDIGNNDVVTAGAPGGAYSGSADLNGGTGAGTNSFDSAIDVGNNTDGGTVGGDDGAYAGSGGGIGADGNGNDDTAIDIGNNSGTYDGPAAVNGTSDYAVELGDNTGQYQGAGAGEGNDDFASIVGNNSTVDAGGDLVSATTTTGNNDIAYIFDPFGTDGDYASSGFDYDTELGGNSDLAAILGVDNTIANAIGGTDLYDIISALGNESGTAAATSGSGFLADLLSSF
jgi:hypothetical protein